MMPYDVIEARYVGGFVLFLPVYIIAWVLAIIIMIGLMIVDAILNSGTAVGFGRSLGSF